MKRLAVLALGLTLCVPAVSGAAPVCSTGSLQSFIDLGSAGCQIGDKVFFDFTYQGTSVPAGNEFGAASISVAPFVTGDLGFSFSAGWGVPPGTRLDSLLGYSVATVNGSK
jgi:hypothetical protein